MEEAIAEKKETESKADNTQQPTSLTEREAEDRERIAQDLKAGLHPLKVLIFFSLNPRILFYVSFFCRKFRFRSQ